jgi:putative drug exporter of the RND superfamily
MQGTDIDAVGSGVSTKSAETAGLGRLAGWCYDHRRWVLVMWVVGAIAIIGLSSSLGSAFSNNFTGGNSAAQRAQNLLAARFPAQAGDTADVVIQTTEPLTDPSNSAQVARLVAALAPLAHVTGVQSPLAPGAEHQVSADGRTGFAVVQFDNTSGHLPSASVKRVIDVARSFSHPGFAVSLGGNPISDVVTASPGSSTGIGVTAAIIIMLVAFGSVVAMGLPIITALVGVGVGFGIVDLLSHVLTVPTFGPELMAMIGLGVGIDYALFVVTRYRQGLAEGREPRQATVVALSTAGRAVMFAGGTVVISLLGLFLVGLPFMNGLAIGSISAVLLVLLGALTLLPAMLGFAGRAIDRLHVPGLLRRAPTHERGFWWRWSRTVQRRPWICGTAALAVLVVLAIPLFSLRLGFSDSSNDPTKLTTRQAYDALAEGFGPGFNGPLVIAATIPAGSASDRAVVDALDQKLRSQSGIAAVAPARFNAAGDTAVIIAYPTTGPEAAQTASLVRHLRSSVIPPAVAGSGVNVLVGGETAAGVDASHYLSNKLPLVIAVVIALSFLLLMAVFRSIAIPVKAALMNLLSMGAAYGVIVAVYQWGWLSSVFGVSRTGPIDPWIPLMMFTIVFGLSMDYEVFLLSRIREEWRRSGVNTLAVADGLASTARVITAAAAIMVCVFLSFVINDPLRVLDVFGLGLAVAVLIDATLVRMVLVPSVMQVLGRANWWMPAWLDRVVPTLGVEVEVAPPKPVPEEAPAGVG